MCFSLISYQIYMLKEVYKKEEKLLRPLIFFHSNHPAKFINRRSPSGISTEGAS